MSQRNSGYAREERDYYPTPSWVTEALRPHLPRQVRTIWEPAAGQGHMSRVLETWGADVIATDVSDGVDFLTADLRPVDAIITNPPYDIAPAFIARALDVTRESGGIVAMLLRTDFDHAQSRAHLFRDCPAFAKKVVLTKRIVWFKPPPGRRCSTPSFNHGWFVWDQAHAGPATIGYGPT